MVEATSRNVCLPRSQLSILVLMFVIYVATLNVEGMRVIPMRMSSSARKSDRNELSKPKREFRTLRGMPCTGIVFADTFIPMRDKRNVATLRFSVTDWFHWWGFLCDFNTTYETFENCGLLNWYSPIKYQLLPRQTLKQFKNNAMRFSILSHTRMDYFFLYNPSQYFTHEI